MWWDHMSGYGWGGGIGWLFMLLFWVLILAGVVALIRWLFGGPVNAAGRSGRALDILNERYARGEIDREQYEQMRRDLEGR